MKDIDTRLPPTIGDILPAATAHIRPPISIPKFPNAKKLFGDMPDKKHRTPKPMPTPTLEQIPHLETSISFFVEGKPEPAGSKRAIPLFNRKTRTWVHNASGMPVVVVIDDNPKSAAWKKHIAKTARNHYHEGPVSCAVILTLTFYLLRPQGHFGTGKNSAMVKGSAPSFHVVKPDVTKLTRAVEDALSGVVYVDDNQIIMGHQWKQYGQREGVQIEIREVRLDENQKTLFDTTW